MGLKEYASNLYKFSMDEEEKGSRSIGSDIMIRRMKNRERQRRYRARKRLLEAGNNENLCSPDQSCVAAQLEPELSCYDENFVPRVFCSRNWKKDARRAHLIKRAQDGSVDSSVNLLETMTSLKTLEASDEKSTGLFNGEKHKIRPGRRDWKAEARNKKN